MLTDQRVLEDSKTEEMTIDDFREKLIKSDPFWLGFFAFFSDQETLHEVYHLAEALAQPFGLGAIC